MATLTTACDFVGADQFVSYHFDAMGLGGDRAAEPEAIAPVIAFCLSLKELASAGVNVVASGGRM